MSSVVITCNDCGAVHKSSSVSEALEWNITHDKYCPAYNKDADMLPNKTDYRNIGDDGKSHE